ncbi:putative proteasome inhibitor [Drosera capensis]
MATEKSVMAVIRSSRPTFRSDSDKLAFAVHASFIASGFVLVSTGPPAFSDSALSESSSTDEVGIEGWNEGEDEYVFVYVDPEKKNRKVLLKCLVMGEKLLVDAVADGSEVAHLEINIDDYVAENAGNNYISLYKNLGKLISSLESEILSRFDGSSKSTSRPGPSSSTPPAAEFVITEQRPLDSLQGGVIPPAIPVGGTDLFPGAGAGMYPRFVAV